MFHSQSNLDQWKASLRITQEWRKISKPQVIPQPNLVHSGMDMSLKHLGDFISYSDGYSALQASGISWVIFVFQLGEMGLSWA